MSKDRAPAKAQASSLATNISVSVMRLRSRDHRDCLAREKTGGTLLGNNTPCTWINFVFIHTVLQLGYIKFIRFGAAKEKEGTG